MANVILLFMKWLDMLGWRPEHCRYAISIHESADVGAAERFWADVVGVPRDSFSKTSLKRHNPKTVRKNTGSDYHGCLTVRPRRGSQLYLRIEGWWYGIVASGLGAGRLPPAYAESLQSPVGLLAGPA